jgi:hypothetical protein
LLHGADRGNAPPARRSPEKLIQINPGCVVAPTL